MKKKKLKKPKVGRAIHKSLFVKDSPFGMRVHRDRKKYNRVSNHKFMKAED